MFVYEPHDATGMLIEAVEQAGEPWWLYSLRSPKRYDRVFYIVKLKTATAKQFREAIDRGELSHHGSR